MMLRLLWTFPIRSRVCACRLPCRVNRSSTCRAFSACNRRYNISTSVAAQDEISAKPQAGFFLRAYQEECVEAILTAFREGRRQVGVSLATGAGKTVVFTELIGRVPPPSIQATRTLILVHRQELVEQAARHCKARYPDRSVDIEMGTVHASGVADITVASIQSITSRDRIDKFAPETFKLLLVDEAHHIVAPTYLRALEHFGLQDETKSPTPALVGFSATFSRFDGLALSKAIKDIVYHKDYIDMIKDGWLSNVIFTTVKSHADLSSVKLTAGDFQTKALSEAVNTEKTNLVTVRSWLTRARDRTSTLVFCVDVAHIISLADTFHRHGVDARYVTGTTKRETRSATLDAFKARAFPVLLNCGVFTEGTDIPNIDCVVLARPTQSRNLLIQMIGRGMRLFSGKENCHIIDMVASLKTGIVTTPTLFGLDPSEMVETADPTRLKQLREEEDTRVAKDKAVFNADLVAKQLNGRITFTDYDSIYDLIDSSVGEHSIRAISTNAWVCVGEDKYHLGDKSGAFLTIEAAASDNFLPKPHWTVRYTAKNFDKRSASPLLRPRVVARSETFESAIRAADTFAGKTMTQVFITRIGPAAAWRERDATPGQVALLNKVRDRSLDELTVADVTRGKAADMLTKLKYGAKGAWSKAKVLKLKQQKQDVLTRKAKSRAEGLGVGSLVGEYSL